eukprot:TRINITY_DN17249_c0_g1_i1.p1 TRINITY_DN17249_c0_g1~~TRINITY_DN17249_c0_g1_i1.p1  ORF type:complete len:294 (+),score=60.00 TRINITY_DN17249_c0_g1_i1:126-1007(+)
MLRRLRVGTASGPGAAQSGCGGRRGVAAGAAAMKRRPCGDLQRSTRSGFVLSPLSARVPAAALACASAALVPAVALSVQPSVLSSLSVFVLHWGPAIAVQVFFLSPLLDVKKWKAAGTTGSMPALPYYAMASNCFLWLAYAALSGMTATVLFGNTPGLVLGLWYSFTYSTLKPKGADVSAAVALAATTVAVVAGSVALLPAEQARLVMGTYGCGVAVAQYSGPLSVLRSVTRTQSTAALSFPLTLAAIVNCVLWGSFGLFVLDDPFMYVPNAAGLSIQLGALLMFVRFGLPKV